MVHLRINQTETKYNGLPSLPKGWVWTTLLEACQYLPTGIPEYDGKIEYYSTGSIVGTSCIPEGIYSFSERPSRANRMAKIGDVLQARMADTNKALLIGKKLDGRLFSTGFLQLRPFNCCVDMANYIYYYLKSPDFLKQRDEFATGSTQVALTDNGAKNITFPLAPLPEQRRIVTKLEELFTRLDAGLEALKKTQAQFKSYRSSMLKAACEGKLVPNEAELAHAEGRAYEPAEVLLARILKERREKWNGKGKYKEPAAPDTNGLSPLPEGWCWTNIEKIGEVSGGLTKNSKREKNNQKMPYLRVANVYAGELLLDEIKSIGVDDKEIKRVLLETGDLLVVEGNGSLDQIGRVALWNGSISPCVHQNHIIKVRFNPIEIGKYVLFWLLSTNGRKQITNVTSSTSGLYTLSISKVSDLLITLPPLAEQRRIVAEVERRLSVADEVARTVEQSLRQADRLRQSILKQAFEGKLVEQNLNDEPAGVLLEHIKIEKSKFGNKKIIKIGYRKREKMEEEEKEIIEVKAEGLYEILRFSKKPVTPKEIKHLSKLDIDDFYAELKMEVENGRIIERRPNDIDVFLEIGI